MKRLPRKFSIFKANIPVSFFGMILGLVGLGNCWRVSTKIWHLPNWIGEIIMLIAVVVWLVLILAYIGKWL
jgi:tellurite resistance protein